VIPNLKKEKKEEKRKKKEKEKEGVVAYRIFVLFYVVLNISKFRGIHGSVRFLSKKVTKPNIFF